MIASNFIEWCKRSNDLYCETRTALFCSDALQWAPEFLETGAV
ncbi:MAG: hypothetical protein QOG55_1000 [Acidobacteriaceae bacterium]|jgi:hypothetical protein|nr:hypothetical protein [Acidobacteriaceae bacterium]